MSVLVWTGAALGAVAVVSAAAVVVAVRLLETLDEPIDGGDQ